MKRIVFGREAGTSQRMKEQPSGVPSSCDHPASDRAPMRNALPHFCPVGEV